MAKLYVIRHSEVLIQPEVAPEQWHLSDAGRARTKAFAEEQLWDDVRVIYYSPQAKTQETASLLSEHLGVPAKAADNLRELSMNTGFLSQEEFRQRVGDYLAGKKDPDFENYDGALLRILDAVQNIVKGLNGGSAVIVSHGRILSVFLGFILGRRVTVDEWQAMKFPELSVIDINTWRIERGFLSQANPKSAVDAGAFD